MDHLSIYANPDIDAPCFLYAQLDAVEGEVHNKKRINILKFHIEPLSSEFGSTYIYSNLYHNQNAERMWKRCRQSLRFNGYDAKIAIGRWVKLYLVPSKFQPTGHPEEQYSTVQYVAQKDIDRARIAKLEHLTRLNAIPWDATDAEEAQQMIEEALAVAQLQQDYAM